MISRLDRLQQKKAWTTERTTSSHTEELFPFRPFSLRRIPEGWKSRSSRFRSAFLSIFYITLDRNEREVKENLLWGLSGPRVWEVPFPFFFFAREGMYPLVISSTPYLVLFFFFRPSNFSINGEWKIAVKNANSRGKVFPCNSCASAIRGRGSEENIICHSGSWPRVPQGSYYIITPAESYGHLDFG